MFYLYLYVGSMLFLFFMYTTLIWCQPKAIKVKSKLVARHIFSNYFFASNMFILRVHVFPVKLISFSFTSYKLEEEKPPSNVSSELNSSDESDTESGSSRKKNKKSPRNVIVSPRRPSVIAGIARHHYGSFYLRMGAVGV